MMDSVEGEDSNEDFKEASTDSKIAVDRLYAIQRNHGFKAATKDTVFIMTSGAPTEMNPLAIEWYKGFEKMGWKDLGMILGADKEAEARELGASIC